MNLDSLITVLSLLVAVYAILPRVRQLELRLNFGLLGRLVVLIALCLILYLQYYQTFRTFGLTPSLSLARWRLTTANVSFLILISTCLTILLYLSRQALSLHRIYKFREFVLELSHEKRYAELFSLIDRNLKSLARIYKADFPWSRARQYFEKRSKPTYSIPSSESQHWIDHVETRKKQVFSLIKKVFPSYQRERDIAADIVHEILLNKKTARGIIEVKPYCVLSFYGSEFYEFHAFFDLYLDTLMQDKGSILYHEVLHNQNLDHGHGYQLPVRNRLLTFLFKDCRVAKDLACYRPIGEAVIAELEERYESQLPDSYSRPMGDFYEEGKWDSKTFVGIRFFDIMVQSALHQNICWHMWLYYLSTFAMLIMRNLDSASSRAVSPSLFDLLSEWPTRYHFLVYEIVSVLSDWIERLRFIPVDQANVRIESTRLIRENSNIPKSAIIVLGEVLKAVHSSHSADEIFRSSLTEIAFRLYFRIQNLQSLQQYAEILLNSIRTGGSQDPAPKEYSNSLLVSFRGIDRIQFSNTGEFNRLEKVLTEDAQSNHG